MMYNWIILMIGLAMANFLWEAMTDKDWERAFERSYFQGWALLVAAFTQPWGN